MRLELNWIFIILTCFFIGCKSESDEELSKLDEAKATSKLSVENLESEIVDDTPFITYFNQQQNGQTPFETKELKLASVKLFANYGNRQKLGTKELKDVYGINQFFMDFDLKSGYVHQYTRNFYNKLTPENYVLYFEKNGSSLDEGVIYYKKISDLKNTDSLGRNVGFFRQWRLSDIVIDGDQVFVIKNEIGSYYLKVKDESLNQFKDFIPLWTKKPKKEGYFEINQLDELTETEGGTVVIIWQKNGQTYFKDVHNSIQRIIECLFEIKKEYNVDPVLGIYDAAPMAKKFKSDEKNSVNFDYVDSRTMKKNYVGAGFGYLLNQEIDNSN